VPVPGSTSSTTIPLTVTLSPALTVTAGTNNALNLEFDLSQPAFIVDHVTSSGTLWSINFNAAVRHQPISDITKMVLRQLYGTVASVAADGTSFTLTKCFPAIQSTTPSCTISTQTLTILADSTNGTLFYDLDAKTHSTITNFASVASTLPNKYVRLAARYQQDGTLVAVRIWASSSFSKVYISPEGHVLNVNRTANPPTFTIVNEDGTESGPIQVSDTTQFLFNQTNTVATGPSFLTSSSSNFVRGFKVHVNPLDPSASPLVADSVDIEIAGYSGNISGPNNTGFTYTRKFNPPGTTTNDYTINLGYISNNTANGETITGTAISGFKWWYVALPTGTLDYGTNAVPDFVKAVNGSVNYGSSCNTPAFGVLGSQPVLGTSYANWNDANAPNAWSAFWAQLQPTPAPLAIVTTAASGTSFGMTPLGTGTCNPVTVDLGNTSGQATLVYQVNRSANVVTITQLDISQANNLTILDNALVSGTEVKVYGVPTASGNLKAYVLLYYTGTQPTK